jgi:hypothetical protein
MRPFAPYDRTKQSRDRTDERRVRRERKSAEWDVRIDCDVAHADYIQETLKASEHRFKYCLMGGLEQPDSATADYGSKNLHVHIALVFKHEWQREEVLEMCRGEKASSEEYAVPRNQSYTYAGWYIHHVKEDVKLVNEPCIRFEFGQLPDDTLTPKTVRSVKYMIRKYTIQGTAQRDDIEKKFEKFCF